MAIEKILATRIQLKMDTLANWKTSTLQLKKGEICFASVSASEGTGLTEPVIMAKIATEDGKTFNELPWAFYSKSSDVLAACKSEQGLKDFIAAEIEAAGIASDDDMEALMGRMIAAENAIDALETLVGEKAVATQIEEAIAALDLANAYDAKGAATTALTDAKAYADGKDEAIAAAKKAGDDAQADVDALAATVGEATEGKTIVEMIADAQTAATYDDTQVKADIKANADAIDAIEADYLTSADKTELEGKITAEQTRAEGIESGLRTDVDAIKADYLKASDKEALQTQIDTIMSNPDTEGAINSINEFTQYVKDHGTIADGFRVDIDANRKAIEDLETANAASYETKDDAATKLTEAKTYADGLNTAMDTRVGALETAKDDYKGYADQAEADAKTYADSLNTAMNTRVEALEAVDHSHDNKAVLDGITAEKVTAWDNSEQNAKGYADQKVADLGIGDYVKKTDADTYYDAIGAAKAVQGETDKTVKDVETLVGTAQAKADSAYTLAEGKATMAEVNTAIINAGHATSADLATHTGNSDIHVTTSDKAKWNAAEQNAKDYADGLNTTMSGRVKELEDHKDDYKTYADQTETDAIASAKAYTDEQVGAIEIPEYIVAKVTEGVATGEDWYQLRKDGVAEGETIKVHAKYDDTALAGRVTTVEGRVTTLEGEKDDVQVALTSKLESITTTENGGLKVTGNNRIDIDDSITFVFDCGDSTK